MKHLHENSSACGGLRQLGNRYVGIAGDSSASI